MEGKNIFKNRSGVALVLALLMLLILTIIGINAITTTTFETSISGNERVAKDAFYAAEAGIQVSFARIQKDTREGNPINTNPIPRTKIQGDSYYRTQIEDRGLFFTDGFGSNWQFRRFQINSLGESFNFSKEIEVQIKYGPFTADTSYNN
ncbi:MAG: pilus assembly PilX N-terminal domain-containing protein [Thermodesulfobacteriota bacterium]